MLGDRKPHRTHHMRSDGEQDVAFGKLRAHAPKAAALQHRKIAMDQPRCRRRCSGGEIALLQEDDSKAAPGRVARHADAIEPAADHRQIIVRHARISV